MWPQAAIQPTGNSRVLDWINTVSSSPKIKSSSSAGRNSLISFTLLLIRLKLSHFSLSFSVKNLFNEVEVSQQAEDKTKGFTSFSIFEVVKS